MEAGEQQRVSFDIVVPLLLTRHSSPTLSIRHRAVSRVPTVIWVLGAYMLGKRAAWEVLLSWKRVSGDQMGAKRVEYVQALSPPQPTPPRPTPRPTDNTTSLNNHSDPNFEASAIC